MMCDMAGGTSTGEDGTPAVAGPTTRVSAAQREKRPGVHAEAHGNHQPRPVAVGAERGAAAVQAAAVVQRLQGEAAP
jgi:hypothetical protein